MQRKTKTLLITCSLVIVVGIIASLIIFNDSTPEDEVIQLENNYDHDAAKQEAINQGYVSEEVDGIEIGMSIKEVDEVLGEEGTVDYEFKNKKKVIYSATEGYQLEVIFEDEKVIGISIVKS